MIKYTKCNLVGVKNMNQKFSMFSKKALKYRELADKFEKTGYLRTIYKCNEFVIVFLSNCCYYIIYYDSGLAVNIRPDALLQVIENPKRTLKAFRKLPPKLKARTGFYIHSDKIEEVFIRVKEIIAKQPEIACYSPDMEKEVFDKYGYPETLFFGKQIG